MSKDRRDEPHVGKLPRRYRFLLNPHPELRLSKCYRCEKLTYPRKFPLFIHIDGWGPLVLGKTCKYCSKCESIMCSQHELEAELRHTFTRLKPQVIGNEYLVIGTVEMKTWRAAMSGSPHTMEQDLDHLADFKKYDEIDYDPGGWRLPGAPPHILRREGPTEFWRKTRPPFAP